MSLFEPVLITPLLKIPILLTRATIVQLACSPPGSPAKSDEQRRFGRGDILTRIGAEHEAKLMQVLSWSHSICEVAIIVATHYPSALSDSILSFLVPGPSSGAYKLSITPQFLLGASLVVAGGLFRLACHRSLGRFFTWDLAVREDHKLITTGPYSIVRHPSYTAFAIISVGNLLCMFSPGSWWRECGILGTPLGKFFAAQWLLHWIAVPAALAMRTPTEDEVLKREFGEEWMAWAKRTPYRLIPFVY
ncbi:hypothetical protein CERSUDRAFT_113122 [Gelatoporia subvermispora B]|uniref:Protein-S-isoprenylcysteine O-methyltransferase n=1 Tax=Ceriporiopsis subvermispora (strain B) TaxID=914234 RepID=M2PNL2_CERS8|nr:hypothetical protein CERSUDRAFT_113122 [Gelatoporia subvermispora B]